MESTFSQDAIATLKQALELAERQDKRINELMAHHGYSIALITQIAALCQTDPIRYSPVVDLLKGYVERLQTP